VVNIRLRNEYVTGAGDDDERTGGLATVGRVF